MIRTINFFHDGFIGKTNFVNLATYLLVLCHHKYNKFQLEEKLKTEKEKYNVISIEWGKATELVNKVAVSMNEVMQTTAANQNDFPKIRANWGLWNYYNKEYDKYFSP